MSRAEAVQQFQYNTTQIAAEGWIYQLNPSPAGTNSVHDQSDANQKTSRPIGYIDFSTWVTETSNIMDWNVWYSYETGRHRPSLPRLAQIADALSTDERPVKVCLFEIDEAA